MRRQMMTSEFTRQIQHETDNMLKTLHGYITKDLIKITLMAAFVFTLLMTIVAIIEPLRKQGLATSQVLMLFSYTLPVTLSLALPFAALFAATMVYGRFSQDRELMACRASGIPTGTVLLPAVGLGVAVSLISLILTNFISPMMALKAEKAIVKNIKKIAYHKLKQEGMIALGNKYMVHASGVRDTDDEDNGLLGVIAGQVSFVKDPETKTKYQTIQVVVAKNAFFEAYRDPDTGKHYASISLMDQVGPISNVTSGIVDLQELPLQNILLEPPSKEKTSFYSWNKLIATYKDPTINAEVGEMMEKFKRQITENKIMRNIVNTINAGKEYDGLEAKNQKFYISAGKAALEKNTAVLTSLPYSKGRIKLVIVRVIDPETGRKRIYLAERGKIEANHNDTLKKTFVTIELSGNVRMKDAELRADEVPITESWKRGQLPLPKDELMEKTSLSQLLTDWQASGWKPMKRIQGQPEPVDTNTYLFDKYTTDSHIRKIMYYSLLERPYKVQGEIVAEMHSRIAIGISCLFLVTMGAALGLMFKGGNMLVAFVLSIIPAAFIIILIMMGKKMIANPDSSAIAGIIGIWGGNIAMMVANIVIYAKISRQ